MSTDQLPKIKGDSYKRWFDWSIIISANVMLLPVWLLLWTAIPLLIWLGDRGPIFYSQQRAGKNGRPFLVVKFRTMIPNADRLGPSWTTEDDPRVTKIGRILRRTALDELPEIISILKGDMSLVGPRALGLIEHQELEKLIPGFDQRLKVLPGLTGLAQVYDRTDDDNKKFFYDQEYMSRMGPWLDIRLLILSVYNTLSIRWDRREAKLARKIPIQAQPGTPERYSDSITGNIPDSDRRG